MVLTYLEYLVILSVLIGDEGLFPWPNENPCLLVFNAVSTLGDK